MKESNTNLLVISMFQQNWFNMHYLVRHYDNRKMRRMRGEKIAISKQQVKPIRFTDEHIVFNDPNLIKRLEEIDSYKRMKQYQNDLVLIETAEKAIAELEKIATIHEQEILIVNK